MDEQRQLEVLQDQALQAVEKKLNDLEDVFGKFPPVTDEELADLEEKIDPEEWEKFIEAIKEWDREVDEQIENLLGILNEGVPE